MPVGILMGLLICDFTLKMGKLTVGRTVEQFSAQIKQIFKIWGCL